MTIKELREKSDVELDRMLNDMRNQLQDIRFNMATRQFTNVAEVGKLKRTIARVLTVKASKKQTEQAKAS